MRIMLLASCIALFWPLLSISSTTPKQELKQQWTKSFCQSALFSYPPGPFQCQSDQIITPTLYTAGGIFSFRRASSGVGSICINLVDGRIALRASQPGSYEITYTKAGQSQTQLIVVN
jgi:hypothetical protein